MLSQKLDKKDLICDGTAIFTCHCMKKSYIEKDFVVDPIEGKDKSKY